MRAVSARRTPATKHEAAQARNIACAPAIWNSGMPARKAIHAPEDSLSMSAAKRSSPESMREAMWARTATQKYAPPRPPRPAAAKAGGKVVAAA
nr:hypothetical protein [Brevibacterium casei]